MIEVEHLSKRYGEYTAVKRVDLSVGAGEIFGFLGPNGAGKSTTIKILCGLVRPTSGRASVGGFDVVKQTREAKRLIGYLPERVPVYRGMTAREYLTLFARLYKIPRKDRAAAIEKNLALVNLAGVDGKPVGKFSKGMVQRLGIARALLADPKVVFFDEPSSGLDPTGRREIRSIIQNLGQSGCTVFLCSHDLGEVQAVCTRIGFIRQGELVKVQKIGEAQGDTRQYRIELAAPSPKLVTILSALPGFKRVDPEGAFILVSADPKVSRTDVARAVQQAGVLHLGVQALAPGLESLYREYVEQGKPGDEHA